jgi:positive regulator of sigma E activity
MFEKHEHYTGNLDSKEYSIVYTSMRRKYILPFLIAVITLILSEYFFLQEVFGRSNIAILILTGGGVALCIAFIVSLIRKYN